MVVAVVDLMVVVEVGAIVGEMHLPGTVVAWVGEVIPAIPD